MNIQKAFEEAIEHGEEQQGSVEFKRSLSKDIHLADEKRESLVAQLRHRVLSGYGEAKYVVGITDDGELTGLNAEDFEETLDVLSMLSQEANAHISETETFSVEDGKLVGLVTIEEGVQIDSEQTNHLVIGTGGHVDHGKSTLIGSLVTGETDNGEGSMRSYLDIQPHEIERGLSADLSYAVYGFNSDSPEPLVMDDPQRKTDRSEVVQQADRLVSFVDTVGHNPWLHTTIRGLVGQRLDYGLLAVSAVDGVTKTTQEHFGIMLAMDLPVIVAITKCDLATEEQVDSVEREIEDLLRSTDNTALLSSRYETETLIGEISPDITPVVRTSAVTRDGFDTLNTLFKELPKTQPSKNDEEFEMYIDDKYLIDGVGTVISGTIKSGDVSVDDTVYIGPIDGEFIETNIRSIEIHYHGVESAKSGQLISVAIPNIDYEDVERGMVISETKQQAVSKFEAEIMILNHPTKISDGYQPVIHLETISETVILHPEKTLLPGDTGNATLEFKFNSHAIEEGQQFVFREGQAKGVGTVRRIIE